MFSVQSEKLLAENRKLKTENFFYPTLNPCFAMWSNAQTSGTAS